jgi:predicted kinase
MSFLKPSAPQLIAIGGLSGSGKTTVAREIAPLIGAFPGAVHLRSDLERKAYFNVRPHAKLPPDAYQPGVSDAIYQIMRAKARLALVAGHSVILDAVHATPDERNMAAQIASDVDCPFHGVWLGVDTSLRVSRVQNRGPDASDADAKVAMAQDDLKTGEIDWFWVDAGAPLDDLAGLILQQCPRATRSGP